MENDSRLTFDTFVVGPANRLACAAARRAAESPGSSFNPLFLYSASGLGKSHILNAIAHYSERVHPNHRVLYQTLEGYLDELTKALEAESRDVIRERYSDLNILLLDDVQFLTGQTQAQEMLLRTLDVLTVSGSQVVLASDRPPAEINGLDDRLLSRFSGGLIVDIGAPEYETRVAIMRRKLEERKGSLSPGVAEALARFPFKNVRELQGGLNRILAMQELEGREVRVENIPELLGEKSAEGEDDFGTFLTDITGSVAATVEEKELPWRRALREAAEEGESRGFSTTRLRALMDEEGEPADAEGIANTFRRDIVRLAEIRKALDEAGNPWPEGGLLILQDPERMEEAEAMLASALERVRPFPTLPDGPGLERIASSYPKLAVRAAEMLVTAERPDYNPLFVWSVESDRGRQILEAAGRSFLAEKPDGIVGMISAADFASDFIQAISDGVAGAWRERWWTVDLLLLSGIEALSDTERAEEEFFHLFEALKRKGARLFLAADRPPSAIEGIDERLRSRFEGGLVIELGAAEPGSAPVTEESAPDGVPMMEGLIPEREPTFQLPDLADMDWAEDGRGGLIPDSGDRSSPPAAGADAGGVFPPSPDDRISAAEALGLPGAGEPESEDREPPTERTPSPADHDSPEYESFADIFGEDEEPEPAAPTHRMESAPPPRVTGQTHSTPTPTPTPTPALDPASVGAGSGMPPAGERAAVVSAGQRARPQVDGWFPSRETVVWNWPDLQERCVEELD